MALRVSSITETDTSSKSDSKSKEHSQSQSRSDSQSTTKKLLDSDLMNQILGGLMRNMTDEEINQFAENLLRPQLNAALEESRQNYETTKLSKEQELENLAASLTRAIDEQNTALSRGMGRSSYTLQTLANQGDALAKAVRQLTDESTRQSGQIQQQITQAAQQNSQTQGRLNTDFASQLAAKVQELKENQRKEWNSNYLTAISAAMGQQTTGSQQTSGTTDTTGEQHTEGSSHSTSVTYTNRGGGGKKNKSGDIDAVTSAAPSAKRR